MIKIVILGPLPPPYGGPEVMTNSLLEGLRERKEFIVNHINTQVSRSLAEKGGKHQLRKAISAVYQAGQLIKTFIFFQPEIVYLSLTNSPSFLGFLRDSLFLFPTMLFGKKIVIQFYGGYYYYAHMKGTKYKLISTLLKRVNLAFVEGQRLDSVFNGLVPQDRIKVIRHGRDGKPFSEACRRLKENAAHNHKPKRVLFVGLMCREKGVRDLLSAVPLAPEAQFVFAGEWPSVNDEKEVRHFLKQHDLEDRVRFVGVLSGDKYCDLMASGDVFVLPSYFVYEGHAVATVDALAAGLPIICTDHGALNEAVRDGWNGFFVPRNNPEAIARRLNQLLSDDELRLTMGERSRRLFEERFTLPQFVENWSQAIKSCFEKSDKGSHESGLH